MARRSSLFTRSKMIRYFKFMEKFAIGALLIGSVAYYTQIKNIEDKEKEKFLSKYTKNTETTTTTATPATTPVTKQ
ncbi:hypothetical protein DICPUDRAFT_43642 [Dictyostelium purpureum]|uniref:Uncharacterized protein n=1 Tax=Dictyostelium purpureum TaxID=5786 RepID=F1A4I7_DICPU|nr:uncharacterized protein DICPUDRAFT_43642 [Dictyostelium purpureum]EGC28891.1 hypothetical protein DICPUDRAFT_43642 [Dictyostelium purpureum]|eukprot:XP_003294583.1 hypothetical protein DICPUDRAFT_43642 [Dictyostelium purpureum]